MLFRSVRRRQLRLCRRTAGLGELRHGDRCPDRPADDRPDHGERRPGDRQPRNRKRDDIELHEVIKKLTDLMSETFIAKRRRTHPRYANAFIVSAIIEKKSSYSDAEPYPHVHALMSVRKEFAPKVDAFIGTNTLKQLPRIDRVLTKTIRTSDLQRAIDSEKSHSVDKWINYFLKYHSVDDPVLMFKL